MQKYYKNCTSTERIAVKEHETKKYKTSENLGFMVTYLFSAGFCHDLSTRVVLKVGQDSMTPHSIKGFPFLGHLSRNWQRREGGRLYAPARSALSRQGQHYYKALLLNAITPPPQQLGPTPPQMNMVCDRLKTLICFLQASGVFSCRPRLEQKKLQSCSVQRTWDVFNSHFKIMYGVLFCQWYHYTYIIGYNEPKHVVIA